MSKINRRNFIKSVGAGAILGAVPSIIRANLNNPRVVVIGGGFAGATAAKYLRRWAPHINVTLVEPNALFHSCILSNLVLNGNLDLDRITFRYDDLRNKYGVNVVHQWVAGIDGVAHRVELSDGSFLDYDRLIVAPGITFDDVPGLDSDRVPHAWKAGGQTLLLKSQLAAMPAGGTFVMTIPKAPYRCPPGPYERACLVADYVKTHKPGAQVIVLDANPEIIVEQETFSHAFDVTYAGIVQYIPNADLQSVDSERRIAVTGMGDYQGDVLNVIPTHRAGQIITTSGLNNHSSGRWADIDPLSYESTAIADIHVIGDSQGTGQPKAGHIANGEAKVCADAIIRLLAGDTPYPAPKTNSACYSPITAGTASWLTAVFAYDSATGSMQAVSESKGAADIPTAENYAMMFEWADNLFSDTFA